MKKILVVCCVLLLSMPLLARDGSRIIVEKFDGTVVTGELLAVNVYTLLLMDDAFNGVGVNLFEVKTIKIPRRIKLLEGLGIGTGTGAGLATFTYFMKWVHYGGDLGDYFKSPGFTKHLLPEFSLYGAVLGGAVGLINGLTIKLTAEDYLLPSGDIDIDKIVQLLRQFAREKW
jgi:small nuclear ribonucleoprotein (snRNP)-like protein